MSIQITPAASDRMRAFLAKAPEAAGVRFSVKRMGCSGFGYVVDLAGAIASDDQVMDIDGIRVVVDPKSLPYIDGTELDFAKEGLNEGFKFKNPNVKDECGCGESFRI